MNGKKERKIPIGIGIPLDLLEEIDAKRGLTNRSEYVVKLIRKALKTEG